MWRTKILEMFGIPPLMPGTPIINTGDAGTPSTCRRDAGNDAAGKLMTDQHATYKVNVWMNLTVENCLNSLENQEEILLLDKLVDLNVVKQEDTGNLKEDKMQVNMKLFSQETQYSLF